MSNPVKRTLREIFEAGMSDRGGPTIEDAPRHARRTVLNDIIQARREHWEQWIRSPGTSSPCLCDKCFEYDIGTRYEELARELREH